MDISIVITIFAIVATNLGTVIALHIQSDNKIESHRKETTALINAIREDIRDFHGRLCAIEERKKNEKN